MIFEQDTIPTSNQLTTTQVIVNPSQKESESKTDWIKTFDVLAWPIVVLIVFFFLKNQLVNLLNKVSNIQIGNFALRVNKTGEKLGISSITDDLKGLTYEELRIFMIVCGENAAYYTFSDRTKDHGQMKIIYEHLQQRGLIEYKEVDTDDGKGLSFGITDKGIKANRAVLDSLYGELINK